MITLIKKPVITTDGKTATVILNKFIVCACATIQRAYKLLSVVMGGGLVNSLNGYLSTLTSIDTKSTSKVINTIARIKYAIECVTTDVTGNIFNIPAHTLIDGSKTYSELN